MKVVNGSWLQLTTEFLFFSAITTEAPEFQVELIYCQGRGLFVAMTSDVICIFTSFLDETDSNQHASLQVVIFTWGLQDLLSFFSRNYFAILCQYVCI